MIPENKEFSKGRPVFGKPRHEERDSRIVDDANYLCFDMISNVETGLDELDIVGKAQATAIDECRKNGANFKIGVESLMAKHIPADTAKDEDFIKEMNACTQDYNKFVNEVDNLEDNLAKQEDIHKSFRTQAQQTKDALYRSKYRLKFTNVYKRHIQKLAALLKMPVFQGEEVSKEKSTNLLKPKFKDFRDLCQRFLIPFANFSNKPPLCIEFDLFGLILMF